MYDKTPIHYLDYHHSMVFDHVRTDAHLQAILRKTRPDQEITLQVKRGGNGPQAMNVRLMRRPFAVVRPELENYQIREAEPPKDFVDRQSFLLTLSEVIS